MSEILNTNIWETATAKRHGGRWRRVLAGFLPESLASRIRPAKERFVLEIRGEGVVRLSRLTSEGMIPEITTKVRASTGDPELDAARSLAQIVGEDAEVTLSLPESCGARATYDLSADDSARLGDAILGRIGATTRFMPEDIYFTHSPPVPGEPGRIHVDVVVSPRALVDESLKAARALGLEPTRLVIAMAEEPWADLLPPIETARAGMSGRMAAGAAASVLLAALAAAYAVLAPIAPQAGDEASPRVALVPDGLTAAIAPKQPAPNAMATPFETLPPPAETATVLDLLAILEGEAAPAALVKLHGHGQSERVEVGTEIIGLTIVAIGEDSITYTDATGPRVVELGGKTATETAADRTAPDSPDGLGAMDAALYDSIDEVITAPVTGGDNSPVVADYMAWLQRMENRPMHTAPGDRD